MKRILHLHLVVQQSNLRSQYAKTFGGQTMETKPYELVDAFWKNWSQSLSLFSSAGKQLEQLTLETLKQQQDALHKLTSGVDELEKELQQFTTQFNNQYTDYVKQLTGNSLNDQINEWQDKWKELSAHMQQLTVSPTKHLCLSLLKQAVNLKKQRSNLLNNNNYNVKRLKTVRRFLEDFKTKQLELAKSSRKTQKSIYFHQVRKMWELTAAQTKLFLPPTTSRWLAFFDMEKKEDKMNPFQEAQTVPELRYDEIQVGDQASLTKRLRMRTLSILQN